MANPAPGVNLSNRRLVFNVFFGVPGTSKRYKINKVLDIHTKRLYKRIEEKIGPGNQQTAQTMGRSF
ncbi:MAG: hypothetical protein KFF68_19135 [Desulfosarcina sp.]|nr:hypothetical protein [Desulfosarcina sp.]